MPEQTPTTPRKKLGPLVDGKYMFAARSRASLRVHTERDAVLFLAQDRLLPEVLAFYRQRLGEENAGLRQITATDMLRQRVLDWQKAHPEQVKLADMSDQEFFHLMDRLAESDRDTDED